MLTTGLLGGIRAPLNDIMSALPGDRLLETVQSDLVGTLGNLPLVGRFGGDGSLLSAVPIVNQLDLANLQENLQAGTLLDGDLLRLPAEFVKIRESFIDAFAGATQLPVDAIRQFLTISESIAGPGLSGGLLSRMGGSMPMRTGGVSRLMNMKYQLMGITEDRPDLDEFITQKKIVELYSTLDPAELTTFRGTLGSLKSMLPGSDGSSFMGLPRLGLLEDVRSQLFSGVFANGPLSGLRESASTYVSDVFPIIGQFVDVDSILDTTSLDLGRTLGLERYPLDGLSRLIDLKMNLVAEMVDFKTDLIVTVADISKELISMAIDVVPIMKELLVLLPQISIEVMMELITVVFNITEGVIDFKLGVIEWVAKLPFELIDLIVSVPAEIFADLEFVKLGILQEFWSEARSMLNMYTDYTGFLNLSPDTFPLGMFGDMSRGLILGNTGLLTSFEV